MKTKLLLFGLATYIPRSKRPRLQTTGGTDSARYCYSVWLRHLVIAHKNGLLNELKTVAEIGPGDSIGIGLAALISGVEKYYALDVVEYANSERNLRIFEELVTLFKRREDIPGEDEFPDVKPQIEDYRFPIQILADDRLNVVLEDSRIELIRNSIENVKKENSRIQYLVPWFDSVTSEKESLDMIYSQAVLEHVDNLLGTYRLLYSWLKPKGFMSHQIDFRCHQTADEWNGHWTYSDVIWKLIRGKRPYLLNREPHSAHIKFLKEAGFSINCDIKVRSPSRLKRNSLAFRFRNMPEDDLTTRGAFIQATKRDDL